eukprot:3274581-Amphidinium_carterae.1
MMKQCVACYLKVIPLDGLMSLHYVIWESVVRLGLMVRYCLGRLLVLEAIGNVLGGRPAFDILLWNKLSAFDVSWCLPFTYHTETYSQTNTIQDPYTEFRLKQ